MINTWVYLVQDLLLNWILLAHIFPDQILISSFIDPSLRSVEHKKKKGNVKQKSVRNSWLKNVYKKKKNRKKGNLRQKRSVKRKD